MFRRKEEQTEGRDAFQETTSERTLPLVIARGGALSWTPSDTKEEKEKGGLSVKAPSLK